jgi:hypothetical protein
MTAYQAAEAIWRNLGMAKAWQCRRGVMAWRNGGVAAWRQWRNGVSISSESVNENQWQWRRMSMSEWRNNV